MEGVLSQRQSAGHGAALSGFQGTRLDLHRVFGGDLADGLRGCAVAGVCELLPVLQVVFSLLV